MKKLVITLSLVVLFVAVGCDNRRGNSNSALRISSTPTFSSFDPSTPGEKLIAAGMIKFEQADLAQVLNLYAEISGRSVIRATNLPDVKISFSNQTPMKTVEAMQALDTVLASQGIATVFQGTQYVKIVPENRAFMEGGPVIDLAPAQLPDSGSFLTYVVKLKKGTGNKATRMMMSYSKLANSIAYIPANDEQSFKKNLSKIPVSEEKSFKEKLLQQISVSDGKEDILILRDYSSNVKRMLEVLSAGGVLEK